MCVSELDRNIAREIIESLNKGNPPARGLEYFTVGLDDYLQVIEKEYLSTYIKNGGSGFKAVIAQYGQGKTHFLYAIRNLACNNNYVVSYATLSPDETPFHKLELVYSQIARRICPPSKDASSLEQGFRSVLTYWYQTKIDEFKGKGLEGEQLSNAINQYLEGIKGLESLSFERAVRLCFKFLHEGKDEDFENVVTWLQGEGYDASYKKKYGLMHKVDRSHAMQMLRSLAKWVHIAGFSGLVLLFDETESQPSFSTRQKESLLNNLRQLIDETTNPNFGHVMLFYSFPGLDFLQSKSLTYEALKQRLETVFEFKNPYGVRIELEPQNEKVVEQLIELGIKLSKVYAVAYDCSFDQNNLQTSIKTLAEACYRERYGGGLRRRFVQASIKVFSELRQNANFVLTQDEAEKLAKGG